MAAEDKEITLGAGKLLGLFFMLAATCGIFFAVGYSLGKTSAREQALQNQSAQTAAAAADPDLEKPTPYRKPPAALNTPPAESSEPKKEQPPDLTFYHSVKEGAGDDAKSAAKSSEAATGAAGSSALKKGRETPPPALQAPEKPAVVKAASTAQPVTGLPQTSPSGTYLVQIAAVTHEEDAAALAGALRKKSYAAAVVPSPNGKDKLFHVVLGPYASLQDAEAMKLKLQGEGYSPIVKR